MKRVTADLNSFASGPRGGITPSVSFGVSCDLRMVRLNAPACCRNSTAKLPAENHIACSCKSTRGQAEAGRTHYESAALTAELRAPRLRQHLTVKEVT